MFDRRCAGNQDDVRRALKKPRERDLHRCRLQGRRGSVERRGLQWSKSSQWEERHVGDALPREFANEAVIVPVRNVVEVLHADDLRDLLRLRQLPWTDIAQTEMTNQSLMLEFGEHREGFLDRFV